MNRMKWLLSCILLGISTLCLAQGDKVLIPRSYHNNYSSENFTQTYYPIEDFTMVFKELVEVRSNTRISIYDGTRLVATSQPIKVENYKSDQYEQGMVIFPFRGKEAGIILPKGREYTLVVPEGVMWAQRDPEKCNKEHRIQFSVPRTLGFTYVYDNSKQNDRSIVFFFETETKAKPGVTEALLYQEGVFLHPLPVSVGWDWDLGQARVDLGNERFNYGVNYSIVLPEGSVRAMLRDDITNDEIRYDFVGTDQEPEPKLESELNYTWCNLYSGKVINQVFKTRRLGEVYFSYKQEIELIDPDNAYIEAYEGDEKKERLFARAKAWIEQRGNRWLLMCDFAQAEWNTDELAIAIPDGTIRAKHNRKLVNKRSYANVINNVSVDAIEQQESVCICQDGVLRISPLSEGARVVVYTIDGRMLAVCTASAEGELSLPIRHQGLLIVTIDGKAHKIINE